jgi:hypothetical protein
MRHLFAPIRLTVLAGAALALWMLSPGAQAQRPAAAPSASDARTRAPLDLTGYWVSVVTEDWRFRMLVADPGDTESVPLNPAGLKLAKAWDPAKARADSANACRAFGAAGLMRIPGRLHISWQDGNTLQVQTDSGTQTRLFHFGGTAPADMVPSWQGYSVASWQGTGPQGRGARAPTVKEGYLQVDTGHLLPGYLRTNGIPYGAQTSLEEYYDSFRELNGDVWLVITTVVTDPEYLTQPFVTSTHFKKLADASGWDPTPCRADEPR